MNKNIKALIQEVGLSDCLAPNQKVMAKKLENLVIAAISRTVGMMDNSFIGHPTYFETEEMEEPACMAFDGQLASVFDGDPVKDIRKHFGVKS